MNAITAPPGTLPPPVIPPGALPGYPGPAHWHRVPATGQHYLDTGSGDPVLLLHGNPSWSYTWRHLLPALSPHVRCLAPDLPGMGLSPRPPVPPGLTDRYEGQLDALEAFFGHLTDERRLPGQGWTLVMHDWGGPLGFAWALRNPGAVTRLVVLNTIAFRWPPGYRLPLPLRCIRDSAPIAALTHLTNAFARTAVRAGVVRPLPAAERRAYLRPYARLRDRRAVVAFVRSIPRHDDEPSWRLLEPPDGGSGLAGLPVFVGWGMRDPVFTPLVLDAWTDRFPQARVHQYADAGHYVMEDAAEELGGHIRDFLRETA
ncbi:alpha/beta fold hydrolase [Streptomyces halobius]|uniref:Alpha/beta fold hydrolase n=1 Tax=Streptomyces halobius TaxID=2879846 RepID=A0ABY4M3F3_9ACTN|nr:alpha/beta fold hydrolase [Streptomyces halobius]UQA90880.1 alpha/beta fold hydrolase [Streptomyces halobius]